MPALPYGEVAGAVEAEKASSAWGRREAVLRVHGVDGGQARRSARGEVGGDRPRHVGVDDPSDEDEDESRAPGTAVRSRRRGPTCDSATVRTDHSREVIEAALAHVVPNQTEAAYARSDLFDRRRQLMDDWMQYLDPERSPRPTVA